MKTEERHRLQEHELRKLTAKAGEFWDRHGMKVLAVLLAVLVIAVGAIIWTVSSQSAAAEGWTKMAQSGNAEQFIAIAEDYSGEPVGHWARLRAAEMHLMDGVEQSFSNRGAAVDELEESVEQFAKLMSADLSSDVLRERALYGHARALEAMAAVVEPTEGKVNATLDDAIAAYEKLLKTYPETIYKPLVEEQLKALKAERTQQFVAWFRQQQPKPSDRELPQDGLPQDGLPPGLGAHGDEPLLDPFGGASPDPFGTQTPGAQTPGTTAPGAAQPGATSPAADTPADSPASDAPADAPSTPAAPENPDGSASPEPPPAAEAPSADDAAPASEADSAPAADATPPAGDAGEQP